MKQSGWLLGCAWALVAAIVFLMLLSGLMVSASTGLAVPAWVAAGQLEHRTAAGFVSLLAVALLVIAHRAEVGWPVRWLSIFIVLGVALQAGLGIAMASWGRFAWIGVMQASLMHAVSAAAILAALLATASNGPSGEMVEDEFRPPLRRMAWLPALLIAAQVVLGSAYRHGLVGVIPHLVGALVVAGFLALVGLMVATTYPKHRSLRRAAMTLVWMVLGQVVLGVFALSYRAGIESGGMQWDPHFVFTTVGHLVLGSLTLAACLWLGLTIRRHVAGSIVVPAASLSEEGASPVV